MTQVAGETRQFSVYARHVDSHHARVLEEASFEAAAVAYLEDFHPPDDRGSRDQRHRPRGRDRPRTLSFRVGLESGETPPCG